MVKGDLCLVMPYFIIGLTIYQEQVLSSQYPSKGKKRVKTLVIATLTKSFNLLSNWEVFLDKIDQVLQLKVYDLKKQFQFQLVDIVEGWKMKWTKLIDGLGGLIYICMETLAKRGRKFVRQQHKRKKPK
ncbi:hypothetical protein ACFE04_031751 [Oxalis oulophora]